MPDIPPSPKRKSRTTNFNTWYGVQVPAETTPQIIKRLNAEVIRIVRLADVQQRFSAAGLDPLSSTPEEFGAMIRAEIAKWAKVAKAAGLTMQ